MTPDVFGNGTKETWRGTVLNEVFRRLPSAKCHRRNLRGIYLSGPKDRDGEALEKRGCNRSNLLAIDIDEESVSAVRSEGAIAICDRIEHVLEVMSENDRLDFVLLDLMGGLSDQTMRVLESLHACPAIGYETVVMINLLAGRDGAIAGIIDTYKRAGLGKVHRASTALDMVMGHCIIAGREYGWSNERLLVAYSQWIEHADAKYFSYLSPIRPGVRLRYDSAVYNWPFSPFGEVNMNCGATHRQKTKAKRKLAAAKAIRTMKLAGRF